ncbi:hypothetical protein KQX54_007779 [Cotesia glomerata]|uniref:Uncharacterized protein n=1 Tax=Cotesia glomerata TaxID=32391 RepID=A0AAV7IY62_COTGL|nr:hypothetical protein KQX54_007779 [Cotesia glomerata]
MHKRISAHRRASVMPPVCITEQPGGSIEHYRYANLVRSRPDNKKDAGSARNGKTVFLNTPQCGISIVLVTDTYMVASDTAMVTQHRTLSRIIAEPVQQVQGGTDSLAAPT